MGCGGTGFVSYWDGSANAGEFCPGCNGCQGKDEVTMPRDNSETTHGGFEINAVALSTNLQSGIEVEALRRRQRDGSSRWVVKRLSEVLNKSGDWEYEPIPSSREDDFIARTRFATLGDAILAFHSLR